MGMYLPPLGGASLGLGFLGNLVLTVSETTRVICQPIHIFYLVSPMFARRVVHQARHIFCGATSIKSIGWTDIECHCISLCTSHIDCMSTRYVVMCTEKSAWNGYPFLILMTDPPPPPPQKNPPP